jgi:hypothetical protein
MRTFKEYVAARDVNELNLGVGNLFKKIGGMFSGDAQTQVPSQTTVNPAPVVAPATNPQRVGFNSQYLVDIKQNIDKYQKMYKSFLDKMIVALEGMSPEVRQRVQQTYQQQVAPHYAKLFTWKKWIDMLLNQLPPDRRRELRSAGQLEAVARLYSDEPQRKVKVNVKNFANMTASIKGLTDATDQWLQQIGNYFGPEANVKQYARSLHQIMMALDQKVRSAFNMVQKFYSSRNVISRQTPTAGESPIR